MELHWSHANSGKHGAAGEGFPVRHSRTITQILERNPEDNFECTYFRQRTNRTPTMAKKGGGLFPMTIYYTLPSELSDGYTDSDSESDNTSNVERWLESLPTNDAWSSVPNYLALNGSEGLEGVDEIQEDSAKSPENDLGTSENSGSDSRRSFTAEIKSSKVRVTRDDLAKHTPSSQDKISTMAKWLDRKSPRKKVERTLKTRQQIPMWTKGEREARTVITNKKLLEGSAREKAKTSLVVNKTYGIADRNISIDDRTAWSNSNTLETTESRTAIKKPSSEADGCDEMMQEMVHRLLTVSWRGENSTSDQTVEKPRNESFSRIDVENSKGLCDNKETKESSGSSQLRLGMKRARLSTTLKNVSPKLAKRKLNENRMAKDKQVALKKATKKNYKRSPKPMRKIAQGRIKPCITKHELKPAQKTRFSIASQPFVENIDPGKKASNSKYQPLSRTVRFQDEVTTRTSPEAWRQTAMAKAARNKQILQTVEQIVDYIESEALRRGQEIICAGPCEGLQMTTNSNAEVEPEDAIELKKRSWRNSRKRPMNSMETKTIGSKKPMFTNPFVENCLDKAMDAALNKYKCPRNTWEDFIKGKSRANMSVTAYEPPAKKRKPKSLTSKLENMISQDFSLFDSWQSIHNYFLLYSSCR